VGKAGSRCRLLRSLVDACLTAPSDQHGSHPGRQVSRTLPGPARRRAGPIPGPPDAFRLSADGLRPVRMGAPSPTWLVSRPVAHDRAAYVP
jgi:hypothetical protein